LAVVATIDTRPDSFVATTRGLSSEWPLVTVSDSEPYSAQAPGWIAVRHRPQ
jgi:hypothetical protein